MLLFPDNDPTYKGADSLVLTHRVAEVMAERGYRLGNIDATVIAQAPKLVNHRIFCIHGGDDGVVLTKRSRDMVKALKEAGCSSLIYEELPGIQHNCWDDALKDDRAFLQLFRG